MSCTAQFSLACISKVCQLPSDRENVLQPQRFILSSSQLTHNFLTRLLFVFLHEMVLQKQSAV
jgi:hypothetical protein